MGCGNDSEQPFPTALKVLVAGGFGAGKTTFIGSVSEIEPLRTEEVITTASIGTDSLAGVERKATTTVAFDFGRLTVDDRHVLYLFGTPGQDRFWYLWDELSNGALGAVVLADTRRLQDCFSAVDFFERRDIPFLVAVNEFEGSLGYAPAEIQNALQIEPYVPVIRCDAREPGPATAVLVRLIEHLLTTRPTGASPRSPDDAITRNRSTHDR